MFYIRAVHLPSSSKREGERSWEVESIPYCLFPETYSLSTFRQTRSFSLFILMFYIHLVKSKITSDMIYYVFLIGSMFPYIYVHNNEYTFYQTCFSDWLSLLNWVSACWMPSTRLSLELSRRREKSSLARLLISSSAV